MFENFDDIFENFDNIFGKDFNDKISRMSNMGNMDPASFMGGEYTKTEESGEDQYGKFTLETYISKDGKRRYSRKVVTGYPAPSVKKENEIKSLKAELQKAVQEQNFEKAAKIRDKITILSKAKV